MRPAAQVQAAIELLDEIDQTAYPADRTMAQYFRQRRYIGSKDKYAISEHFYAVLRSRLSLQYLLQTVSLQSSSRLLMAVHLLGDDQNLREIFDDHQYHPTHFGQTQLDALHRIDFSALQSAASHIRLNVPEWIAPMLEAVLGERFEVEMLAMNQRATTDIRVNSLKTTPQQLGELLTEQNIAHNGSDLVPLGIVFDQRVALFNLDCFKQGWFEIQDQGSQMLALATGAKAGDKVVDFCAGAGGKTLAMAAMMQNKGTLYACDVHSKRLEQLHKRCKRAGAHNVRIHQLSSEHDKWVKQHAAQADVVLIDAPCSGTGTWRRNPDSRWNLSPKDLQNLIKLQQSILCSAARLVKPGGRLVYATCSLLSEENEAQVEQFLTENDQFARATVGNNQLFQINADKIELAASSIRTYPAMTGCDGFFACALQRADET